MCVGGVKKKTTGYGSARRKYYLLLSAKAILKCDVSKAEIRKGNTQLTSPQKESLEKSQSEV